VARNVSLARGRRILGALIACHNWHGHVLQTHHAFDPCCACNLLFSRLQASENSNVFWSFIETWQEPNNEVDDSCWGAVHASASQHLSTGSSMSLQQALAARQYTAKVEMLRNLAEIPQVPSQPTWCLRMRLYDG